MNRFFVAFLLVFAITQSASAAWNCERIAALQVLRFENELTGRMLIEGVNKWLSHQPVSAQALSLEVQSMIREGLLGVRLAGGEGLFSLTAFGRHIADGGVAAGAESCFRR